VTHILSFLAGALLVLLLGGVTLQHLDHTATIVLSNETSGALTNVRVHNRQTGGTLVVDRIAPEPVHDDAMRFPIPMALAVGFIQCLAMIPGVSRSGATIVGALMMGSSKRAAAEFSFFLSMPTMAGAFAYDLYKNRDVLDASAMSEIAVGFAMAFVSAVLVVRWLLGYVSKHGYALFGWWRIIVGTAAVAGLLTLG